MKCRPAWVLRRGGTACSADGRGAACSADSRRPVDEEGSKLQPDEEPGMENLMIESSGDEVIRTQMLAACGEASERTGPKKGWRNPAPVAGLLEECASYRLLPRGHAVREPSAGTNEAPQILGEGAGLRCIMADGAPIFWSVYSTYVIGRVLKDELVVTVGPPQKDCENPLVPIAPTGAVQLDFFVVESLPEKTESLDALLSVDRGDDADLYDVMRPLLATTHVMGENHMLKRVQAYLRRNPPPNEWRGPKTALLSAVHASRPDLVQVLLKAGMSPHEFEEHGVTPLHNAVFDGNAAICILLLEAGADTNVRDIHGQTPIFFAPTSRICAQLVEHQADINLLNQMGQSALHLAGRAGYRPVHVWLVKHARRFENLTGYTGPSIVDLQDSLGKTSNDYLECGVTLSGQSVEQFEKTLFGSLQDLKTDTATQCPKCEKRCVPGSLHCVNCGVPLPAREAQEQHEKCEDRGRGRQPRQSDVAHARDEAVIRRSHVGGRYRVPNGLGKNVMTMLRALFDEADALREGVIRRGDLLRVAKKSQQMRTVLGVDDSTMINGTYEVFTAMDPNNRGSVNWAEFKHFFLTKGRDHDFNAGLTHTHSEMGRRTKTKARVKQEPRSADRMERLEWQRTATSQLREVWLHADANRDGYLTKAELIRACATSPKMRQLLQLDGTFAITINEVWDSLDRNKSGAMSWGEFLERFTARRHIDRIVDKEIKEKKPRLPDFQLKPFSARQEGLAKKKLEVLKSVWEIANKDGNGIVPKKDVIQVCSDDVRLQVVLKMEGYQIAREVAAQWKTLGFSELNTAGIAWKDFLKLFEMGVQSHICANCGNTFADDASFCRKCGVPRPKDNIDEEDLSICKNCGNQFAEDAQFCRKCGNPRPTKETTSCKNCGNQFAEDSNFCRKCGTPRPTEESASPTSDQPSGRAKVFKQNLDPVLAQSLETLRRVFGICSLDEGKTITKKVVREACETSPQLRNLIGLVTQDLTEDAFECAWRALNTQGNDVVTWREFKLNFFDGKDISPQVLTAARLPERDLSRVKFKTECNIRGGTAHRTPMSAQMKMLQKFFRECDRDGSGTITKKEILFGCSQNPDLKKLMNVPGSTLKQGVQKALDEMDEEGTGRVTFPNFFAYFEEFLRDEDHTKMASLQHIAQARS